MRRGLILFIFVALAATVSMAQLSGTYYIPQGANPQGFANLTAAFNAVTTGGLSANTTFLIDADQNIADSLILSRSDLGPTKTLTIRPAPTKTVTITVTADPTAIQKV